MDGKGVTRGRERGVTRGREGGTLKFVCLTGAVGTATVHSGSMKSHRAQRSSPVAVWYVAITCDTWTGEGGDTWKGGVDTWTGEGGCCRGYP